MTGRRKLVALLVAACIAGYTWLKQDFPRTDRLLIHNGTVITLEPDQLVAEAVLVERGRIVRIGPSSRLLPLATPETEVIDLNGRTLLPGFIDSHTHPVLSTFMHGMVDLSGFTHRTNDDVWNHLRDTVRKFEDGDWIICRGLDPVLIPDLKTPDIAFLDSIAPNNPLFIVSQSLHSYWANSLAFAAAGIDHLTPDPSMSSYYEKDDQGNLTGYIAEQEAFTPFRLVLLAALGKATLAEHCVQVMDDYAANGFTTITSLGLSTSDSNLIRLYDHLSSEHPSAVNQLLAVLGYLPTRKPTTRHVAFVRFDAAGLLPASSDNGDDFFRIAGIKFWYDGAPYAGTMYLREPYLDTDFNHDKLHIGCDHTGEALLSQEDFTDTIRQYQQAGWQIAVHAQGDTAIQETVQAFEDAGAQPEHRHRIEHCLLLEESTISNMQRIGLNPSFHINHLYYYGETLRDQIIGAERTDRMLPVRAAIDADLISSLHADQPMFASEPFSLMHTAVNRRTREGSEIGADHAISVEEALKAVTINAAWQIKMEDRIGSIRVGKLADFVIVDRNPLETPKSELRTITVDQTIVNGQTTFRRTPESQPTE